MPRRIGLRDGERVGGKLERDSEKSALMFRRANRDAAGSRSHVCQQKRFPASPRRRKRRVHQHFRFRARNQDGGRYRKIQRVKLLRPAQIGQRNPPRPLRNQPRKLRALSRRRRRVSSRNHRSVRRAQRKRQQKPRFHARRFDPPPPPKPLPLPLNPKPFFTTEDTEGYKAEKSSADYAGFRRPNSKNLACPANSVHPI